MVAVRSHKVLKGETLDSIAKKYRADPRALWKHPQNKALAGKRGSSEDLQPGDILAIPPSESEVKEEARRLESLRAMRDVAGQMMQTLQAENARIPRRIKAYEELIDFNIKATAEIVAGLKDTLSKMKSVGDGVDAVATVAQLTASLTKICSMGLKSTKLSGAALQKLNNELLKEVVGMPNDVLKDVGIKFVGELRERADSPLGYIGVVANSWEKMTSPSFWANTFVQVTQNQKSWSDAVAMDVGDDIKERIQQVVADCNSQVQKLKQKLAEAQKQDGENSKLISECQARIKWSEQEAAKIR